MPLTGGLTYNYSYTLTTWHTAGYTLLIYSYMIVSGKIHEYYSPINQGWYVYVYSL